MHARDSYIGALLPTYGGRTSDRVVKYVMTVMGLNILSVASLAHRLRHAVAVMQLWPGATNWPDFMNQRTIDWWQQQIQVTHSFKHNRMQCSDGLCQPLANMPHDDVACLIEPYIAMPFSLINPCLPCGA